MVDADAEEADLAIQFAEQMSRWYSVRLTFNTRHPIGRRFFTVFEKAKEDYRTTGRYDGMDDVGPANEPG